MNLCFNCGKGSPRELCYECEELGVSKNRPSFDKEQYEKIKVLKEYDQQQMGKGLKTEGKRLRNIRRKENKKPRKKIKKL